MKKELVNILCCPVCKKELELEVKEEDKDEIITGSFYCKKCDKIYEIKEGIPDLLVK
jgi:uncharacterized protein YbaR (Trm112 family)